MIVAVELCCLYSVDTIKNTKMRDTISMMISVSRKNTFWALSSTLRPPNSPLFPVACVLAGSALNNLISGDVSIGGFLSNSLGVHHAEPQLSRIVYLYLVLFVTQPQRDFSFTFSTPRWSDAPCENHPWFNPCADVM